MTSNKFFGIVIFFFVSVTGIYAENNCESFLRDCTNTRENCINDSLKFCENIEKAQTTYDRLYGGPVLAEGIFAGRKTASITDETLQNSKTTTSEKPTHQDEELSYLHTRKASVRLKLKDYDGVLKHTAKAIGYYSDNKDAYRLQIIANYKAGNYPDVIKDTDIYSKLASPDAEIYTYKAFALLKTDKPEQSYETANYALELSPELAFAYFVRSQSALKLKNYSQTLQDIYFAAKLDSRYIGDFRHLYKQYKKLATGFDYKGDLKYLAPEKEKTKQDLPILVFAVFIFMTVFVSFSIFKRKIDKGKKKKPSGLLGQYEIIHKIGEGGMGIVYKGFDTVLKRPVAIKKLRTDFTSSKELKEQMLAEARLVASLKHHNILEIYTVFEEEGDLYLIFEFVEGQTLQEKLKIEGPLSLEKAKSVFSAVCDALGYAHKRNIIHRDLKPANIMITDEGAVKVMDFGIAADIAQKTPKTGSGTPAYMPPEQEKGIIKKESDIYSLGVCLYEVLTGRVPWELEGYDPQKKNIILPSKILSSLSQGIDKIIRMSVSENSENRYKTVSEFCKALKEI